MKKWMISLAILAAAAGAIAQDGVTTDSKGLVTLSSRGNDVRSVVHDLFSQLGKNYVLDPTVRLQPLYLSLKGVEFDEALLQVCKLAELKFEIQNEIFYVTRVVKPIAKGEPKTDSQKPKPEIKKPEPTKGSYPASVLQKRVTTRFDKVDLRELAKEFAKQTGLAIEIDAKVPKYRVDAYLNNTSLKYALDQITEAANLRYRMTDRFTIEIVSNVSVSVEDPSKTGASH